MSRFGTLRGAPTIANAVMERLKDWQKAYVDDVNDQFGLTLPGLKAVIRLQDIGKYPQNMLPVAVVMVANTVGDPEKDERGYYSAHYNTLVGVIGRATSEEDTRLIVEHYGIAVRGALTQRRKLADGVVVEAWSGEHTDNLEVPEKKHLLANLNTFTVRLDDIVSWKEGPGPLTPPPPPGEVLEDWPTIQTDPVLIIQKEPIP